MALYQYLYIIIYYKFQLNYNDLPAALLHCTSENVYYFCVV